MLIETLSTTGRKVTFPMGSDGSPTMKYTTLLVSIVKSFRKGIGGRGAEVLNGVLAQRKT